MHEAQRYLLDSNNPPSLYVRIAGRKRRLFINRPQNVIGIINPGKKKTGTLFYNWDEIEKVLYPKSPDEEMKYRRLTAKYQKLAQKATFSNPYQRKVLASDPDRSPYENGLTTGTRIDGEIISLSAVEKWCGEWDVKRFKEALKNRTKYRSITFDFRGYDGTLWVEPCTEESSQPGDVRAGFSKEYRGRGNGYYYLLINDDTFIGYDID